MHVDNNNTIYDIQEIYITKVIFLCFLQINTLYFIYYSLDLILTSVFFYQIYIKFNIKIFHKGNGEKEN